MASQLIEQVKLNYKQSLTEKAKNLKRLWGSTKDNPDELLGFLHQLAGSAGMYGYDAITEHAEDLSKKIKSSESLAPYQTEFKTLYKLLIENSA